MPQQRQALATRRAITLSVAEEFERTGYEGTSLGAILRRAGVTKGAFYFHFSSKKALAVSLVRLQSRVWSWLWRRWKRRELDPLAIVVGALDEAMRLAERDVVLRAGCALACRPTAFDVVERPEWLNWERQLVELLRSASEAGLLRSDVDPSSAARTVHAAAVGSRVLGTDQHDDHGMAQRASEMWRVVLHGIASSEWLRRHPLPGPRSELAILKPFPRPFGLCQPRFIIESTPCAVCQIVRCARGRRRVRGRENDRSAFCGFGTLGLWFGSSRGFAGRDRGPPCWSSLECVVGFNPFPTGRPEGQAGWRRGQVGCLIGGCLIGQAPIV